MKRSAVENLLEKMFGRNDDREYEVEALIQRFLASVPPCTTKVIIASPLHDPDYRAEFVSDASALLPWAQAHAKSTWSLDREDHAACQAFPLWLAAEDVDAPGPSHTPQPFFNAYSHYVLDLVLKGLVEAVCPECARSFKDFRRTDLNERRAYPRSSWTSEWHCPNGHLLFRTDHEVRFF
jgi:hypothetical protein